MRTVSLYDGEPVVLGAVVQVCLCSGNLGMQVCSSSLWGYCMEGCTYLYTETATTDKLQSKMNTFTLVFFFMVYYTNNYIIQQVFYTSQCALYHCMTESLHVVLGAVNLY